MKFNKLTHIKGKYIICGLFSMVFAFIIYRIFFVRRIFSVKEGNQNSNNSQKIDSMIVETGNKIKTIQDRDKGQQEKVQNMDEQINTINKELNNKMHKQQ